MKQRRNPAAGISATRERPKFPVISEQMQRWSATLEAEVQSWPAVACKRMFGFRFLYRRKAVFAALPYSRGLFTPSSILLKFNPMPTGLFQQAQKEARLGTKTRVSGKGWFSFELFSDADVRHAIWLAQPGLRSREERTRQVKPKLFYLVLCILGAVLPYSQFVPWLAEHGVNGRLFVQQLFATRISTFFALDVIVSAVVMLRFIRAESSRLRIAHVWLAIPATLLVGVSLGLPLFLYHRELQLERTGTEVSS